MPQRINDYEKFAVHIKGMETPVVDPMGVQGYGGLGYAVASGGNDHSHSTEAQVTVVKARAVGWYIQRIC